MYIYIKIWVVAGRDGFCLLHLLFGSSCHRNTRINFDRLKYYKLPCLMTSLHRAGTLDCNIAERKSVNAAGISAPWKNVIFGFLGKACT